MFILEERTLDNKKAFSFYNKKKFQTEAMVYVLKLKNKILFST